jgi:general secretion pathway protein G
MLQLLAKKFNARARGQAGFTLLELVIVVTVMIILASIAVPLFQNLMLHSKEVILKDTLFKMRDAIDKYTLDKEEAPQSLDDLVRANYIREVPLDPVSGQKDWEVEMEDQPISKTGKRGIKNVFSGAQGTSTEGKAYKDF